MEAMLAEKVPLGAEDYVGLMQARTEWVRDDLTGRGGVSADRLFLVAPKPVSTNAVGQSRVQLV